MFDEYSSFYQPLLLVSWARGPQATSHPLPLFLFHQEQKWSQYPCSLSGYIQPSTPKQINACVRSSGIYLPINAFQLNHSGLTRFCAIDLHRPSKGYATPQPDPRIIGYNHIDVKMFLDMGFLWRRDRAYTLQSTPIAPGTWPHCTKAD